MARHYLLTRARSASGPLFPGVVLDDAQRPDVAGILASGARTYPAPDAIVGAAAARCEELRLRGGSAEQAEALMLEAASRAEVAAIPPPAAGYPIQPSVSLPIPFAEAQTFIGSRLAEDYPLAADGALVASTDFVVGDDLQYWTFTASYFLPDGTPVPLVTGTTQNTGGIGGMTPGKAVSIGAVPAQTIPAGSVVAMQAFSTGSPLASGFAVYLARA